MLHGVERVNPDQMQAGAFDKYTNLYHDSAVKVEVRATGLKAIREKRGLTQRKLARDLGISQNYIPAIEANARQAGPKLQDGLLKYFGCKFDDLFEVVLIDSESGQERLLNR